MSINTIRICREFCEKLRYIDENNEFSEIYSLDIVEDEQGEQTMVIAPLSNIIKKVGSD